MKKVLYIGSKALGRRCLEHLYELSGAGNFEITAVIARHDDDEEHWYPSVSEFARSAGLRLFMPERINSKALFAELSALDLDIGLCVFHPQIFKRILGAARGGIINLHFAPLPLYRGCSPIPHAIIDGRIEHGVTMHVIEEGIDSGPIVSQSVIPIGDKDTGREIYLKCEEAGLELFKDTVSSVIEGTFEAVPQDEASAVYHYRNELDDRSVDPAMDRKRMFDYVRALDFPPFPRPYIDCGGGKKIYLTTIPYELEAEKDARDGGDGE